MYARKEWSVKYTNSQKDAIVFAAENVARNYSGTFPGVIADLHDALQPGPLPSDEELLEFFPPRYGFGPLVASKRVYAHALRLASCSLYADGYHETTADLIDDIQAKFRAWAKEIEER